MIINIKYYVMTIIAIFLAIGIGIFIGIMLDGQDLIVEQQQQLVGQLQSEFDQIKEIQDSQQERIDILTNERDINLKFIDKVYPEIIKNKCNGLDVIIVETNENYSYFGLSDSFEKAGVRSVNNVLIKDRFLLTDKEDALRIAESLKFTSHSIEEIQRELILFLSNALIQGEYEKIQLLKKMSLIDYLDNLQIPMDNIILAGGNLTEDKTRLNRIDLPLIDAIRSKDIPVLVVEKSSVSFSGIQEFKKSRVSTIDNVDTLIGKVSMIMVISGQEGHFGEKETAEDLMPEGFITTD